jgi:hypothetical protein
MATATPQWESPVEKVVLPKFRPVPLFVELRAETVGVSFSDSRMRSRP